MGRSHSPDHSTEVSGQGRSSSSSRSRSPDHYRRLSRPSHVRPSRKSLTSAASHRRRASPQRKPAARLTPASDTVAKATDDGHALSNKDRTVLSFPALDTSDDKNRNLWTTLSKVAAPRGPYTHEIFFVITVHNGTRADTSKGSIWTIIRGACNNYQIGYKELVGYDHDWYPVIANMMTNYNIDTSLAFYGHGRSNCVGAAPRSDERQRSAALSGLIAHACEHKDLGKQIADYDEGVGNILRALSNVKHTARGRI